MNKEYDEMTTEEFLLDTIKTQKNEIKRLNDKLNKIKQTLLLGFDTQETIFKALEILKGSDKE